MNKKYAENLLEKTKQGYNLIAEEFSKHRTKPWEGARFLFDYAQNGDKIIDLGCGAGQFYEFLKDKKINYSGIDISEKLIEIARKKYKDANFKVADAMNLPFPDNYFDKVYAIALLHNIPSIKFREKVIKEIKRVLKKDGMLFLTAWNLWQKLKTRKLIYKFYLLKVFNLTKLEFRDILMNWKGMEKCYFHCFTKKELKNFIERNNLKIIENGEFFDKGKEKKSIKTPNSNFYIITSNKNK